MPDKNSSRQTLIIKKGRLRCGGRPFHLFKCRRDLFPALALLPFFILLLFILSLFGLFIFLLVFLRLGDRLLGGLFHGGFLGRRLLLGRLLFDGLFNVLFVLVTFFFTAGRLAVVFLAAVLRVVFLTAFLVVVFLAAVFLAGARFTVVLRADVPAVLRFTTTGYLLGLWGKHCAPLHRRGTPASAAHGLIILTISRSS